MASQGTRFFGVSGLSGVLGRTDLLLLLAAVPGILLFLFVLPRQHPDRVAANHVPPREALAQAVAFAEAASGLNLDRMKADWVIRRDVRLLDSLQIRHGRKGALERLRGADQAVYYWRVRWTNPEAATREEVAHVSLTLDGRPFGFHLAPEAVRSHPFHREALALLFDEGGTAHVDSVVAALDSADVARFGFLLDGPTRRGPGPPGRTPPDGPRGPASLGGWLSSAPRIMLDRSDTEGLARHHLAQTVLGGVPVYVDSVYASGAIGRMTATVRFASVDTTLGQRFTADVEVFPTGGLSGIETSFVVPREEAGPTLDAGAVFGILQVAGYVLLCIIALIVFFRRINARLIDTRMAMRDGMLFGLAAGVALAAQLSAGVDLSNPAAVGASALGVVLVTGAVAVLVFCLSGGVNSIARDQWADKLQTVDLLRQAVVRNVPVGLSLLRGLLCGFILIGLTSLTLLALPHVRMHVSDESAFYGAAYPGLHFVEMVAGGAFFAFFLSMAAVLGTGALVARNFGAAHVPVAIALVFAAVQFSPLDLRPIGFELGSSAALGLVVGWTLRRFDFTVVLVTIFSYWILWSSLGGWAVPSAPEFLDSLLVLGAVGVMGVFAVAGMASRRTSTEIPVIVPEYIAELARKERLEREMELAREVQLSFLPSETPRVPGLDLASICLPAHEVGGDYYDFFRMGRHRLGVVVGDVSGKGMQAAFYMTLMKGILQSLVQEESRPAAILRRANALFRSNAPRGIFMSMIFGVVDHPAGTFTFARAGHNPLLVHRSSSAVPELVRPNGAAIGLAAGTTFDGTIEEMAIPLAPGDLVVIYTDGVTEAMNLRRETYDEERMLEVLCRARGRPAGEIMSSVVRDVDTFCGPAERHDDMTMVILRVVGLRA